MSLHKMNLVMTYPVRWTEYGVLSNFVQNFFDAIGPANFAQDFKWEFRDDGALIMQSEIGFARDWLFFIGTSTKHSDNVKAAGCFGEGFKIASLAGMRDYGLDIFMESRDWKLHVTSVPGEIAGKQETFLAYEVFPRPYRDNSVLYLFNAGSKFADSMQSVMSGFYYKENPLFGNCLVETDKYAVYECANSSETGKGSASGHLFARFQDRAFLQVPLIICNHIFFLDSDDRDRDRFDRYAQEQCILDMVKHLDPFQSLEMLLHIRCVWCDVRGKSYYFADWEKILPTLIRNILNSDKATKRFLNMYADQLIVRDTPFMEHDHNRRNMAMAWYRQSAFRGKRLMVSPAFHLIGIKSICELCEENDGFTEEREPDDREQKRIHILHQVSGRILKGLIVLDDSNWPDCQILINPKAPVAGYTKILEKTGGKNYYNMKVRAHADHIYLEAWLFCANLFAEAFTTYAHELLHQFGGDSSVQFHKALQIMNERILQNISVLQEAKKEWREIGKAD